MLFDSLPNDKILKEFADDTRNLIENFKFGSGRIENIVGIGENAGYHHFLLFPKCFQGASFSGSSKVGIACQRVNSLPHNHDYY